MQPGTIVILNLQNPREKIIGSLQEISPSGIFVRGLDVNSFNDWMTAICNPESESTICPTSVFLPMHRVVSCYADEEIGEIPSFGTQFKHRTGTDILEFLG